MAGRISGRRASEANKKEYEPIQRNNVLLTWGLPVQQSCCAWVVGADPARADMGVSARAGRCCRHRKGRHTHVCPCEVRLFRRLRAALTIVNNRCQCCPNGVFCSRPRRFCSGRRGGCVRGASRPAGSDTLRRKSLSSAGRAAGEAGRARAAGRKAGCR